MSKASEFLKCYGMDAESIVPMSVAEKMVEDMKKGLAGKASDMPMIPTYLKNDGVLPLDKSAVVIDAGGTNFRCGLVKFTENGIVEENVVKQKMPGIGKSATWEEFISFVADAVEPHMNVTDLIGFCFSYSADITPDIDGKVIRIDKEVVVTGSEGKMIGASLSSELKKRGMPGKKVVIINDTAAVLLGGTATFDKTVFDGFIGQVSGTGTNTCAVVDMNNIPKLKGEDGSIIINLESGLFTDVHVGEFDNILDANSNNPGSKRFEKLTAGVYLGEIVRLMLLRAGEEDLISDSTLEYVKSLGKFDAAIVDAWSCGEKLENVSSRDDAEFIKELSVNMFDRSARCMSANLTAIMMLNNAGVKNPCCICAEGSLVQRSRKYRPILEKYLSENCKELGRSYKLFVGQETTLPGAAAAVLLNK